MKIITPIIFAIMVFLFGCNEKPKDSNPENETHTTIADSASKTTSDSLIKVYEDKMKTERAKIEREKEIEEMEIEDQGYDTDDLKSKLLDEENSVPLEYLKVDYDIGWTLTRSVVKGTIHNRATMATFKNVKLRINCFSKTRRLVKSYEKVVDEFIMPRGSKGFNIKLDTPKATKTIGVEIIGAEPASIKIRVN